MIVKVQFQLDASRVQNANAGLLVGDFNKWDVKKGFPLTLNENGSLSTTIKLKSGASYEYRYLLSDGRWENDDKPKILKNAYGQIVENCVIKVTENMYKLPNEKTKSLKMLESKNNSKSDDLTKILGITAKIQTLFKSDSVLTYQDLGKCTMKRILLVLDTANTNKKFEFHTTWGKQAKLAAAGKWDELLELQKKISSNPINL